MTLNAPHAREHTLYAAEHLPTGQDPTQSLPENAPERHPRSLAGRAAPSVTLPRGQQETLQAPPHVYARGKRGRSQSSHTRDGTNAPTPRLEGTFFRQKHTILSGRCACEQSLLMTLAVPRWPHEGRTYEEQFYGELEEGLPYLLNNGLHALSSVLELLYSSTTPLLLRSAKVLLQGLDVLPRRLNSQARTRATELNRASPTHPNSYLFCTCQYRWIRQENGTCVRDTTSAWKEGKYGQVEG